MAIDAYRSIRKAYARGLRSRYKPNQMTPSEISKAKGDINIRINELLMTQMRMKQAMIEQYGQVKEAKVTSEDRVLVAYINAMAEVKSSSVEAKGSVEAAFVSQTAKEAFSGMGMDEVFMDKSDELRELGIQPANASTGWSIGSESTTNSETLSKLATVLQDSGVSKITDMLLGHKQTVTPAEREILVSDARMAVSTLFTENAKLANIPATEVNTWLNETLFISNPALQISEAERREAIIFKRSKEDIFAKIEAKAKEQGGSMPSFAYFKTPEAGGEYVMEDFIGDTAALPDDTEITKELATLRAQRENVGLPQYTDFTKFRDSYNDHEYSDLLTEYSGRKDAFEAAYYYSKNPDALEEALNSVRSKVIEKPERSLPDIKKKEAVDSKEKVVEPAPVAVKEPEEGATKEDTPLTTEEVNARRAKEMNERITREINEALEDEDPYSRKEIAEIQAKAEVKLAEATTKAIAEAKKEASRSMPKTKSLSSKAEIAAKEEAKWQQELNDGFTTDIKARAAAREGAAKEAEVDKLLAPFRSKPVTIPKPLYRPKSIVPGAKYLVTDDTPVVKKTEKNKMEELARRLAEQGDASTQ